MTASNLRQVRLHWTGEGLVFEGGPDGGPSIKVDSDAAAGPAPTHLLLLSLSACMAIDVRLILEKSRVPLKSLEVEAIGERAEHDPRKFVSIELVYRLSGPEEEHEARLQRAVELSRDKYCSVLHSLDPSTPIDVRIERQ